jgi:hypothetical protein
MDATLVLRAAAIVFRQTHLGGFYEIGSEVGEARSVQEDEMRDAKHHPSANGEPSEHRRFASEERGEKQQSADEHADTGQAKRAPLPRIWTVAPRSAGVRARVVAFEAEPPHRSCQSGPTTDSDDDEGEEERQETHAPQRSLLRRGAEIPPLSPSL